MSCPYLNEVAMLFCSAWPVRKPLPTDRVRAPEICALHGFEKCPLYREALARAQTCAAASAAAEAQCRATAPQTRRPRKGERR